MREPFANSNLVTDSARISGASLSLRKYPITVLKSSVDCRELGLTRSVRLPGAVTACPMLMMAAVVDFPDCLEHSMSVRFDGDRRTSACMDRARARPHRRPVDLSELS